MDAISTMAAKGYNELLRFVLNWIGSRQSKWFLEMYWAWRMQIQFYKQIWNV